MYHWTRYCFVLLAFLGLSQLSFGQEKTPTWLKPFEDGKIKPFGMFQIWGTYSQGQEVFDGEAGEYQPVDDRLNFLIRRARIGFRARPYDYLKITVVGYYDLIGRDALAATRGGYNPGNGNVGGNPQFGIWDAFFTWKISRNSEALNLTGGYFRPQLSRESITSGWSVNSFEKALSQTYIRRHLVGTGPGRATGVNLGGNLLGDGLLGFNYNVGVFNPVRALSSTFATIGAEWAPLLVGRGVLYIGDPEQTSYKIGYDINYFGKRRGLSIGFGGAMQGATERFDRSQALSADFLLNLGPVNLDGDLNFMTREGQRVNDNGETIDISAAGQTGHIRGGYNIFLNRFVLEPSAMWWFFQGPLDAEGQVNAATLGMSSGTDQCFDVGVNLYMNSKRLKLALHYTWQQGDAGDAGNGFTGNDFFRQRGIGAIQRGNYLGLGLTAIY